jgi:hypothetical protein
MRIRQIKQAWWLDKDLRTRTTADVREFYIGLWMLADDAGWLVWDVERIAAELYSYQECAEREANVREWSDILRHLDHKRPHLRVHRCGHAQVPKMVEHQRIAGKLTLTVETAHRKCLLAKVSKGEPKPAPVSPGRVGKEVGNQVGNGIGLKDRLGDLGDIVR